MPTKLLLTLPILSLMVACTAIPETASTPSQDTQPHNTGQLILKNQQFECTEEGNIFVNEVNESFADIKVSFSKLQLTNGPFYLKRQVASAGARYVDVSAPTYSIELHILNNQILFTITWIDGMNFQSICELSAVSSN